MILSRALAGPEHGIESHPMSRKLYAVYPGHIMSQDGDRHFLSFSRLCRLYQVNPGECIDMSDPCATAGLRINGLKILHPQHNPDDYNLTPETNE